MTRRSDIRWLLGLAFGWVAVVLLANLAFWGIVGYVAWHFISKFW